MGYASCNWAQLLRELTQARDNARLPPEPHPRRQRRPLRHPPSRRRRLPCLSRAHRHHRRARIPRPAIRKPEGRILSPCRARYPQGGKGEHAAANAAVARRAGERGGNAVCCKDTDVEETRAVQGQGHICQWGNDQAEEQEDQVSAGSVLESCTICMASVLYVTLDEDTAKPSGIRYAPISSGSSPPVSLS